MYREGEGLKFSKSLEIGGGGSVFKYSTFIWLLFQRGWVNSFNVISALVLPF